MIYITELYELMCLKHISLDNIVTDINNTLRSKLMKYTSLLHMFPFLQMLLSLLLIKLNSVA
jgi:hypothetical protein